MENTNIENQNIVNPNQEKKKIQYGVFVKLSEDEYTRLLSISTERRKSMASLTREAMKKENLI